MSEVKLLPCPCCGSEVNEVTRISGDFFTRKLYIKCDMCGVRAEAEYPVGVSLMIFNIIEENLIQKWNTRKLSENMVEQFRTDCYGMGLDESQTEILLDDIRKGGVHE